MTKRSRLRVLCIPTGPDEYAAAIVRALASEVDIEFVLPEPMLERYRHDLPPHVRVHPVRWPRHREIRNIVLLGQIIRLIRMTAPDIVHFLGDSVVWLALAVPYFRRWPIVVTVHDVSFHPGDCESRTVPMATINRLRRAADTIIVHGDRLRRDLLATGVAPRGGVHVVHHPVLDRHMRLARTLGLTRHATEAVPTILFFGRMMAYKGLGLLIEASDRVQAAYPGVRFVVAGRGPDLARWRLDLECRPWFEVRDRFVPDHELAQLFLDADIVVLPYIEASQSGVAALAIGSRTPIVATAVGEVGALVQAADIGTVVDPCSKAVAAALSELLRDPVRCARYTANADLAARHELSAESAARGTVEIYRRTLAARATDRVMTICPSAS